MITVGAVVGRGFLDVNNELCLFIGVMLTYVLVNFWAVMILVENDHVTARC